MGYSAIEYIFPEKGSFFISSVGIPCYGFWVVELMWKEFKCTGTKQHNI